MKTSNKSTLNSKRSNLNSQAIRERLFQLYIQTLDPEMEQADRNLLDRAFPNEAELNIMQSGAKQIGRTEILANDFSFLKEFGNFIQETGYLKIYNIPENLNDAIQLLMCERSYLIQLIKGLIDKILPKERPKFFDDPFLEMQYQKLERKRDLTPQIPLQQDYLSPNRQNPLIKRQQRVQLTQHTPQPQQIQPGSTVIEDLVKGAHTLIKGIGKNLSTSPRPRNKRNAPNQLDNMPNVDSNRVMYLRIPPTAEKKRRTQMLNNQNDQIINQFENIFFRKEQVVLNLETQSESDDSVDVKDSSESDLRTSKHYVMSHQLPNKGMVNVFNKVQTKFQQTVKTSHNAIQKKNAASRYEKKLSYQEQEPKPSQVLNPQKKQSQKLEAIPQVVNPQKKKSQKLEDIPQFVNSQKKQSQTLEDIPQVVNHQKKQKTSQIQKQQYKRQEPEQQEQEEEEEEEFKFTDPKLVPIEDFINLLDQNESKYVQQNNESRFIPDQQENLRFSQHDVNESQSTFAKQSQPQLAHFKSSSRQSRIIDTNFSRLHHDFSISSSDKDEEDGDQEDEGERKRRKEIAHQMIMSRESSFGVIGFKSEDYSLASNQHFKSSYDDASVNNKLQQINDNRKKKILESDSEEDRQSLKFKIKKRKGQESRGNSNAFDFARQESRKPQSSSKQRKDTQNHTQNLEYQRSGYKNEETKNTTGLSKNRQSTNDSNIYSFHKRDSTVKSEYDFKVNKASKNHEQSMNQSSLKSINRSVKWKDNNFFDQE